MVAVFSDFNQPDFLDELDDHYENTQTAAVLRCLRELERCSPATTAALLSFQQTAAATSDLMQALMTKQYQPQAKALPAD